MSARVAVLVVSLMLTFRPWAIPSATADDSQSVKTESGKVRCLVYANDISHGGGPLVVCETYAPETNAAFPQAPIMDPAYDGRGNLAVVKSTGQFWWDIGDIPGSKWATANDIIMQYGQTYHINGWTIYATSDGTRFTNDRTGHGMFVSVENVYSF